MKRYDIAIIGSGPAGLEAAITAKIRNKDILLLGSKNLSTKVEKAHEISNYLGLPSVTGEGMQQAFQGHIKTMGIDITEDRINAVYSMGEYFALQGRGENYEATKVILACGMPTTKVFPGEMENLGSGVSYCATCDAMFYRGKEAIVVGYAKDEEEEATFLAEVCNKVYYLPMYPEVGELGDKIEVIKDKKPVAVKREDNQLVLELADGTLAADGIFILRESVAPSQLVPGLAIEKNQVVVDRKMRTNITGLYACGDITGAPYQYIKSAGEGNVAALSAVSDLGKQ